MPAIPSEDERHRRLLALSVEWGIPLPQVQAPLTRPQAPPTFRTQQDDELAEDILKKSQLSAIQTNSSGNLKRAFTTKRKTWEVKEVFYALDAHVATAGTPGVAQALIDKLHAAGGDVNGTQKSKTSFLNRRKSLENFAERSKLLQQAIKNEHLQMVQVLLPHADSLALDTSLPFAIRSRNAAIVEALLRYGASASQTADGQDAFRQACAVGGQPDLVALLLQSEGRPSISWVSQAMVDATKIGCLETVLRLSRSTADGNFNNAEALKIAISQGRRDIALVIVMGNKPPQRPGLDEAFAMVSDHLSMSPNEKLATAEVLLCAGAGGDGIAVPLCQAASGEFLEMVYLLAKYGASIEYGDAAALRMAISNGRTDIAEVMLSGASTLNPLYASDCISLIPKKIAPEQRLLLLNLLLRRGAGGPPLDNILCDASEAGDIESVKLLLTPQFPGRLAENHDIRKGPRAVIYDRHEIASPDHNNGFALRVAVERVQLPMVKAILAGKPINETLTAVFPETLKLSAIHRHQMVECFLTNGLKGPAVSSALQAAIDEKPPMRDERLIGLLLKYNADVNFNEGASIVSAIARRDMDLLAVLFKGATPQTVAIVVPRLMEISDDPKARRDMMSMLCRSKVAIGSKEISNAVVSMSRAKEIDTQLLELLLHNGKADINVDKGLAVTNGKPSHFLMLLVFLLY
jgi:hypothetical protein